MIGDPQLLARFLKGELKMLYIARTVGAAALLFATAPAWAGTVIPSPTYPQTGGDEIDNCVHINKTNQCGGRADKILFDAVCGLYGRSYTNGNVTLAAPKKGTAAHLDVIETNGTIAAPTWSVLPTGRVIASIECQ
jgi:hypothetical protein